MCPLYPLSFLGPGDFGQGASTEVWPAGTQGRRVPAQHTDGDERASRLGACRGSPPVLPHCLPGAPASALARGVTPGQQVARGEPQSLSV